MTDWARVDGGGVAETLAHHLRAMSASGDEDFERTYLEAAAISPAGELAPFAPQALWVLFDLVEAAVRTDRLADARAHVAAMRDNRRCGHLDAARAGRHRMPGADGCDRACDADIRRSAGDPWCRRVAVRPCPREARIRRTSSPHRRFPPRPPSSSRTPCAPSRICGATPWERRATAQLRAIGLPAPKAAGTQDATLNAQDLEIATLAASGLTNKQIAQRVNLSHRTVGAHLYRIFPILGISSRAALHDAITATSSHMPDAAEPRSLEDRTINGIRSDPVEQ